MLAKFASRALTLVSPSRAIRCLVIATGDCGMTTCLLIPRGPDAEWMPLLVVDVQFPFEEMRGVACLASSSVSLMVASRPHRISMHSCWNSNCAFWFPVTCWASDCKSMQVAWPRIAMQLLMKLSMVISFSWFSWPEAMRLKKLAASLTFSPSTASFSPSFPALISCSNSSALSVPLWFASIIFMMCRSSSNSDKSLVSFS
mmetsp:Transcript_29308/g.74545  ORF Transcript_29308/g.74545 Transcript_29308/m.74545 type:complete len:201 (+) Transcript_29308:235-837(+)